MTNLIIALLAASAIALSVTLLIQQKSHGTSSPDAVMDNILSRTSVRSYQDKPVEDKKIEQVLRAAMAAPSALNHQPWRFVVIRDGEKIENIKAQLPNVRSKGFNTAIVVCGDLTAAIKEMPEFWVQDASAATQNLLLAANSLGLGAVWCGIYPNRDKVKILQQLLGLPEYVIPLNVIPIGYPAENPVPKDKWKPENIIND